MYPENPEGTQVIVGSMNMGYIYPTLPGIELTTFRPGREPMTQGQLLDHINPWTVGQSRDELNEASKTQFRFDKRSVSWRQE